MTANFALASRRPQRLTITVSYHVAEHLVEQSNSQGRSISNLAAYLLEVALGDMPPVPPIKKRWPSQDA
jgi:hypothetical protein